MAKRKHQQLKCDSRPVRLPDVASAEELARLAWAVAHPARVRIVRLLINREACVCGEIVAELPLAQSTVSQHLLLKFVFWVYYVQMGEDENKTMVKQRRALWRSSRKLNTCKWPSSVALTEDFFVCPADGSQYFCDDWRDIVQSLSSRHIAQLQSNGYLGTESQPDTACQA